MKLLLVNTLFLACLLLAPPSVGQKKYPLMEWQKNKPLRWEHFRGTPDATDVVHAAVTYAGLEVSIDHAVQGRDNPTFKVKAVFDPQQSWVHPSRKDPRVLAHEQLHFDITEVYARKMQQRLNSLQNKKDRRDQLKKIRHIYTKAQLATQVQFDEETLHGLHVEREQEWRNKIHQELATTTKSLQIMPSDALSQKKDNPLTLRKGHRSHSSPARSLP